jgi:hypothetical protein
MKRSLLMVAAVALVGLSAAACQKKQQEAAPPVQEMQPAPAPAPATTPADTGTMSDTTKHDTSMSHM